MSSKLRRAPFGAVVLALAASACSNAAPAQPEAAPVSAGFPTTSPDVLALEQRSTSTIDDLPSLPEGNDDPLPTDSPDVDEDAVGAPDRGSAGNGTRSAAPSTTGVPAGYSGALGRMDPNQLLFGPIAPLPTAIEGAWPLTGLPGGSGAPAVVVKIDNSSKARPQAGLNQADVVIEEEVESGITRFAAIFHSADVVVGPVRSGRTTDLSFLHSIGAGGLVYSGANTTTDTLLRLVTSIANYSAARSGGFWREPGRAAPSNLFADTASFRSVGSPPPAWFDFGTNTVPGSQAASVSVTFPGSRASWSWDGSAWLRTQNGSAHVAADGSRVSAANVIVVEAPRVATGMVDSVGSTVPEFVWAGQGRAVVFTGGQRYEGVWTRSRLSEPAVFSTADGEVLRLSPGRTWIEIVEAGNHSST